MRTLILLKEFVHSNRQMHDLPTYFAKQGAFPVKEYFRLRLGAQSFTLLNTLRDPTQLRRRQWATRQQHLFFGCPLLSSLEQLISAPNHE